MRSSAANFSKAPIRWVNKYACLLALAKSTHQYEIVGVTKDAKYQDLREEIKPVVFVAESQRPEPPPIHPAAGALASCFWRAQRKAEGRRRKDGTAKCPSSSLRSRTAWNSRYCATASWPPSPPSSACSPPPWPPSGLYGVISYMVARRRGEIGIRMALGASRGVVMRLILKEAAVLLLVGLTLGTVLAVSSGKAAGTLLFGLKPTDPLTIALAVVLLAFVALVASFIPALRAARTQPMVALREE